MSSKSSFAQILKSSSVMGGAAGINMLLGMLRTKFAAVLLGAAGVGILTSFTAIQGTLGTLFGLGIQSSAVREVAVAVGKGDQYAIGKTIHNMRRMSWLTGVVGMLSLFFLGPLVSQITFGSGVYAWDVAGLGVVILLSNISGGQMALIQGMRRINDMARVNILSSLFTTVIAAGFYFWFGLRGIVPALLGGAAVQLALSSYFVRHMAVPPVVISWKETFGEASSMVRLGLVFMWNGLIFNAVSYITVYLIARQIGVQAVGFYSAAFALSGVFVNYVLGAMGSDYYPRLTGVAQDKPSVIRLVNEQTEIGLLLSIPGLLLTMVLAPWLICFFYSHEFLPAVDMLQWFILGSLGRVISWPLGFVMLALGKTRWFFLTETISNVSHVGLIVLGLSIFGLEGTAIAFFTLYLGYVALVFWVSDQLIGFRWSRGSLKLIFFAVFMLGVGLIASRNLPILVSGILGICAVSITLIYCTKGLIVRLGSDHKFSRITSRILGFSRFFR